ncbi:MAG: hypothetical protein ACP5HG_18165, partial [Anaerolineae bacterium]
IHVNSDLVTHFHEVERQIDAFLIGMTAVELRTWDALRLIDFLETRPLADSDRISVANLSADGTVVLFWTTLEPASRPRNRQRLRYHVQGPHLRDAPQHAPLLRKQLSPPLGVEYNRPCWRKLVIYVDTRR